MIVAPVLPLPAAEYRPVIYEGAARYHFFLIGVPWAGRTGISLLIACTPRAAEEYLSHWSFAGSTFSKGRVSDKGYLSFVQYIYVTPAEVR